MQESVFSLALHPSMYTLMQISVKQPFVTIEAFHNQTVTGLKKKNENS